MGQFNMKHEKYTIYVVGPFVSVRFRYSDRYLDKYLDI